MALSSILQTVREDDFVEYYLFPKLTDNNINNENEEIFLASCLTKINSIVDRYSKNYIWHKDKFNIVPRTTSSCLLVNEDDTKEYLPPHLYGVTHFGDNIEDEWFVVFLLMQITHEFDGVIARVTDSDGEFLLIEAANYLPSWANPETCEKRVYLYKGQLHLIPLHQSRKPDSVDICEALDIIYEKPYVTEAATNIQKAILSRIDGYPEKIEEFLHRTTVYLPVGVAAILNNNPNLIAPAILAFCNRDPIDMKACRAMKYFPPENRVYTSVLFTKCLYAMLCHSKYVPDRRTGWNLPQPNSPQYKPHILGVKIACGFEILAAYARGQNSPQSPQNISGDNLENDRGWQKFLTNLKDRNYFRDLLEHSQEYNNLLNKAKDYFRENQDENSPSTVLGQQILELNKKLDYSVEDFKKNESSLPENDDESWLDIQPEELDKMLEERYGSTPFSAINGHSDAGTLSQKLAQFLEHSSGIDGAEFPLRENHPRKHHENSVQSEEVSGSGEKAPVRPQRGIKKTKAPKAKVSFCPDSLKPESSSSDTKINFDPQTFSCAVQNILDLVIPDDSWDLESGSEMSEYGDESETELDKIEGQINPKIKKYMDAMDKELAATTVGQSFEKKNIENDSFDDIENFQPVDIDMNALKNILQSYQSQMGAAGPASNMLGPMGVNLEASSSRSTQQ